MKDNICINFRQVLYGNAVGRYFNLNFPPPADRVDIRTSPAISEKGSFQHGTSIIVVDLRKTAC